MRSCGDGGALRSAAAAEVNDAGNPLGKKALGKPVVAWMAKGMALAATDWIKGHEDEVYGALVALPSCGSEVLEWSQGYLDKHPVPKGAHLGVPHSSRLKRFPETAPPFRCLRRRRRTPPFLTQGAARVCSQMHMAARPRVPPPKPPMCAMAKARSAELTAELSDQPAPRVCRH